MQLELGSRDRNDGRPKCYRRASCMDTKEAICEAVITRDDLLKVKVDFLDECSMKAPEFGR